MASVIWALPSIIAVAASAATGIWALARNSRNPVNQAFARWMGFFTVANAGAAAMVLSGDEATALLWARFQYVGVLLLWPSYAFFAFRLLGKRFSAALLYAPFALLALLLPTDLLVKGAISHFWGYEQAYGPLFPAFIALLMALMLYVLYSVVKAMEHVPGRLAKEKLALLAIPAAIPFIAAGEALLPAMGEYVNAAIHVLAAVTAVVIAYALVLRK